MSLSLRSLLWGAALLFATRAMAEPDPTMTLDGTLYASPASTAPLVDSAVQFRLQILDASKACVLYEELQTAPTNTDGGFNIQLGSAVGSAKRVAGRDPGNKMSKVYQNLNLIPAINAGCASGYTPALGAARYVRISVKPSSAASEETLSPEILIDSVPTALVAETVQGFAPSDLLRVKNDASTVLTQSNLESVFSATNFLRLLGIASGAQTLTGVGPATAISATGASSGNIFNVTSTSTAATTGDSAISVNVSGANAGSNIFRYGVSSVVTSTGATSTNVAGYFSAAGGTNNYGLIVGSGYVGIGTTAPETTLDVNGSSNLRQAYYENLGALGTLSCGSTDITGFSTNIYSLTACASGTTTLNIPSISGWPSGSKVWNVTFFVTGQTGSIFNVTYAGTTTNVFWDKSSTSSVGGSGFSGFAINLGSTDLVTCVVLSTGKVYCGVAAQY